MPSSPRLSCSSSTASVCSASRCSSVSPMQTIGARPAPSTATSLRFTARSVSPNSARRSEWPRITYSAPASCTMPTLTSPVNAPSRSQCTFCAPTAMLLLRAASAAACRAVNGGATTISTSCTPATSGRSSLTHTTASWTVLNIFQLPAIRGRRMAVHSPQFKVQSSKWDEGRGDSERCTTSHGSAAAGPPPASGATRDVRALTAGPARPPANFEL
jgi:hypothetical protein